MRACPTASATRRPRGHVRHRHARWPRRRSQRGGGRPRFADGGSDRAATDSARRAPVRPPRSWIGCSPGAANDDAGARASWAAFVRRHGCGWAPCPASPPPRLSEAVGVESGSSRRPDRLGLGGNKVGCWSSSSGMQRSDTLITGGGPASNWGDRWPRWPRPRPTTILVIYGEPAPLVGTCPAELSGAEIVSPRGGPRVGERGIDARRATARAGRKSVPCWAAAARTGGCAGVRAATLNWSPKPGQNLTQAVVAGHRSCAPRPGCGRAGLQHPGWRCTGEREPPGGECVPGGQRSAAETCALLEVGAMGSAPIVHSARR